MKNGYIHQDANIKIGVKMQTARYNISADSGLDSFAAVKWSVQTSTSC